MARPKKTIRPVHKKIALPEDIVARVDLELYSELEGKVPFAAWSQLVTGLLRQHFKTVTPMKEVMKVGAEEENGE